jgi:hypothetical protein
MCHFVMNNSAVDELTLGLSELLIVIKGYSKVQRG